MSNRDGRRAKSNSNKTKYQIGKVCPKCTKGRLEKAGCNTQKGHEHHFCCKTCNFTNF